MGKQERFARRKAATAKAAEKDAADKKALVAKVNQPGGAGKLSKKDLKLARRMEQGEGT
jgi:hypothetical protein